MFADFNKVFKDESNRKGTVPPQYIKYLNETLPDGIEYTADNNGNCFVTAKGKTIKLSGFKIIPNSEQKKVLGDKFTLNDLLRYAYNSQEKLQLKLDKDGYILLNDQEIPIANLSFNFYKPISYKVDSYYIFPSKFPNPVQITIGCQKYERTLEVERVPKKSISTRVYKSNKNEAFSIRFSIDNNYLNVNFSLNISKVKTIRDMVEFASIYNAFIDGTGTFCGQPLKSEISDTNIKKFDSKSILFWEKVLKIEELLDVTFTPPKDNVNFDTICLVEELYQNLINNVPIKRTERIDSIDCNCESPKEMENKPILFNFETTNNIKLFESNINLPCIIFVFNSIVKFVTEKNGKQKLVLYDEDETNKRYASSMYFKSKDQLILYKKDKANEISKLFRDAKRASDYLI